MLTGNRSTFTNANLSDNKNSVTTYALDVQATFAPFVGTLLTTGVGYLRDSSADEFSRVDFVAAVQSHQRPGQQSRFRLSKLGLVQPARA